MDLAQIGEAWLTTLTRLAVLGVGLGLLTWLMPCNPGMFWYRSLRALLTDLVYWFIAPLFTRFASVAALTLGVALLYRNGEANLLPVRSLPLWTQALLILLIQDLLLYWLHRGFHGRWAWRFHAVHHSPKVLDWTSTSRFHPVNQVFSFCLADVVVLLLGFSSEALAGLAVFNVAYSAFVHANLNWTFGSFRYVLASPVFHRWHHTTEEEGLDKNFASTFPILDVLFGTFYMPEGKLPERFGVSDEMPASFLGQLLYPFRPAKSGSFVGLGVRASLGLSCVALVVLGALIVQADAERRAFAKLTPPLPQLETDPCFDLRTKAPVLAVAISDDGRYIASGGTDGSVKRWEPAARLSLCFPMHARAVKTVAISAKGGRLVSGGYDRVVRVLDAHTQEELASRTEGSGVTGVAISAEGETVASCAADGMVRVWKATDGKGTCVRACESVTGVALSPEGDRVAAACPDGVVRVWDLATGRAWAMRACGGLPLCVTMSSNGRRVAAGDREGRLHVWDGDTGLTLQSTPTHQEGVLGVAMTPDGQRIATCGDTTVRIWDALTGREEAVFSGHHAPVMAVAVSADGLRAVSASQDGSIKMWVLPPLAATPKGEEAASD